MFKSGISNSIYKDFLSSFQSYQPSSKSSDIPFVFVDESGIKIITEMISGDSSNLDDVFALSVAEDGWMEFLALYESL